MPDLDVIKTVTHWQRDENPFKRVRPGYKKLGKGRRKMKKAGRPKGSKKKS